MKSELMRYSVTLLEETAGSAETDPEVIKEVSAANRDDAIEKAIDRVRIENPSINHMRIWSRSTEPLSMR